MPATCSTVFSSLVMVSWANSSRNCSYVMPAAWATCAPASCMSSVSMGPGQIALQRMPWVAYSAAVAFVRPFMACLPMM